METITILNPEIADALLKWCKLQNFEQEIFSGRTTSRFKKWWGAEAEFYFGKIYLYERNPIDGMLELFRDKFCPMADSILLYYYPIGAEIGEHLDKKCFEKEVTLINLVDDQPNLIGEFPTTKFRWNRKNYQLLHGEVIRFDSRIIHSVPKVKIPRYSLQFRNIIF